MCHFLGIVADEVVHFSGQQFRSDDFSRRIRSVEMHAENGSFQRAIPLSAR